MDAQDRQLLTDLFDRMRSVREIDKDPEAEQLINSEVRRIPDSAYMLVQSVVVQEHALQQAEARIHELERQVQAAQARPAQSSGGSIFGNIFGGNRSQPAPQRQDASTSPWGPAAQQQPTPPAPRGGFGMPGQMPGNVAAQQPRQGGGFLRGAMATAAGVAGGVLIGSAISNMMNGGSGSSGSQTAEAGNNDPGNDPGFDTASNDPGTYDATQDASYDSGGDWGGGGDIEL
jgi:hypothetical protein